MTRFIDSPIKDRDDYVNYSSYKAKRKDTLHRIKYGSESFEDSFKIYNVISLQGKRSYN